MLRAHFLAAVASDAFPVVVLRRLRPVGISEVHGLSGNRTVFNADPAFYAELLLYIRSPADSGHESGEIEQEITLLLCAGHVKGSIAISSEKFLFADEHARLRDRAFF